MHAWLLGFLLLGPLTAPAGAADAEAERLRRTLESAQQLALRERKSDASWNFASYLGTHFISQYSLFLRWLNRSQTFLDPARLKELLLQTQRTDGSWQAVRDSAASGDLNATVLDYFALKAMGLSTEDPALSRARNYILSRGGIQSTATFTKIFLALFGDFPWHGLPPIPFSLFSKHALIRETDFGQWVSPHLLPIAYLRHMQLKKDLGPAFRLDELWSPGSQPVPDPPVDRAARGQSAGVKHLVQLMIERQRSAGSWGGYTLATLFTSLALQDYGSREPESLPETTPALERGIGFVEDRYFRSTSPYLGAVQDGRYWDTALVANALLEAGTPADELAPTGDYLKNAQTEGGGFPFGQDFSPDPDTDDTAEIVITLTGLKGFEEPAGRAVQWLSSMQNRNGGWAAFAKNNLRMPLVEQLMKGLLDSASLWDESCADITGHVLEALASAGLTAASAEVARQGVRYLEASQDQANGYWPGRWGINYLYGTSAAVVGLIKVGVDPQQPVVTAAVAWLRARQNADGGFGESSLSYEDARYAGVGPSTPTQTGWALSALVAAGQARSAEAKKAAGYLLDRFERDGRWIDPEAVGTGHPKIVYMEYPSYPYSFPLTALARYSRGKSK